MQLKRTLIPFTALILTSILVASFLTCASFGPGQAQATGDAAGSLAVPKTVITVTSASDPDTSKSNTCISHTPCTLRRAIVQARNVADVDRPVLIQFDIPATPEENYDSVLEIWHIYVLATTDTSVFRRLNGDIIIDGSTQTGGRSDGPKIFIVGPTTGQKDGLIVGDIAGDDNHEIRGLGFQNFKTHMYLNTSNNLIEDNWFGLSDDGSIVSLRDSNPEDGSGNAGIALASGSANNIIQNNVFLGLDGVAVAVRGDGNVFTNNRIGTAADGTVSAKQTTQNLICTSVDWLGGGGISVDGVNHTIEHNIFAGLRQEVFQSTLQPDAIRIESGDGHSVRYNAIGVDAASTDVGVCGRGIYMADSPENMLIAENDIAEPGLSAISLNGILYDANVLRSNIIRRENAWPQIEGNPVQEDAIQMGPGLPDPFETFLPAKVSDINGTAVSGTSGDGSACPNCVVEVFLDDTDTIAEALQALGTTSADASGNWSLTLPFELSANQGLRTTSTTAVYNTIPNISAGTTTGLSSLYSAQPQGLLYLPMVVR